MNCFSIATRSFNRFLLGGIYWTGLFEAEVEFEIVKPRHLGIDAFFFALPGQMLKVLFPLAGVGGVAGAGEAFEMAVLGPLAGTLDIAIARFLGDRAAGVVCLIIYGGQSELPSTPRAKRNGYTER